MGVGKTTIGKMLAEELEIPFVDLDKAIEMEYQKSISDLFLKGEIFFRSAEREVLQRLLAGSDQIILAVGGGTPCYYDNMNLLRERGVVYYLRSSIPELVKRISINKEVRPLVAGLADESLMEFVGKHLFERRQFYEKAQVVINANQPPQNLVKEIIENEKLTGSNR